MHRKCPRWSASCARTRPAHPASRYKLLQTATQPSGPLKYHRTRNAVGFVSASSTAGAHNLDLLLHRPAEFLDRRWTTTH
jgi:hypothetical protein